LIDRVVVLFGTRNVLPDDDGTGLVSIFHPKEFGISVRSIKRKELTGWIRREE